MPSPSCFKRTFAIHTDRLRSRFENRRLPVLDLQRDALRAEAIDDAANLYHDFASRGRDHRPISIAGPHGQLPGARHPGRPEALAEDLRAAAQPAAGIGARLRPHPVGLPQGCFTREVARQCLSRVKNSERSWDLFLDLWEARNALKPDRAQAGNVLLPPVFRQPSPRSVHESVGQEYRTLFR